MKVGDLNIEEIVFEKTKELLLRYGVKGWNMNDLSKECNMSKRTLYKIIGNKEELLYRLNYNSLNSYISRSTIYLSSEKSFVELLGEFSNLIMDSFNDYSLNSIKSIRVEYPRIKDMEEKQLSNYRDLMVRFFEKGKDEGAIVEYAKPKSIEKIVHSLIEYNIYNCDNQTEFKREMEEALGVFLKGILK